MKPRSKAIVGALISLALLTSFSQLSLVKSETSSIENQALAYITNVLPFDTRLYNITMTDRWATTENSNPYTSKWEFIIFSLISGQNAARVSCTFVDGGLFQVQVSGSRVGTVPNASMIDDGRYILEKHQSVTGLDSTELISLLEMVPANMTDWANVNETKLMDIYSGNIVLTISHLGVPYTYTYAQTDFRWGKFLANGTFYTYMTMYFGGKDFVSLIDDRPLSVLDNASVNISKDQAISTAMNYLENYSYTTLAGVTVSGFNVSQYPVTATLLNAVRDRFLLSPCWTVLFNLTQTYPDGVNQLFVTLWADTGEIFASGNLAPKRYLTNENPNPAPAPSPSGPLPLPSLVPITPISSAKISPATATINVNESVHFTAVVKGGNPPFTINWGAQPKVDRYYGLVGTSYSGSTFTFNSTSPGTYIVYFFLKDSVGQTAVTFDASVVTVLSNSAPSTSPTLTSSPNPSSSTSATPSSSPNPTPTVNLSASQTPTVKPSSSQSDFPTQQPTSTPIQPALQEAYYIVAAVAAAAIIVAIALLLRNRHRNQNQVQN